MNYLLLLKCSLYNLLLNSMPLHQESLLLLWSQVLCNLISFFRSGLFSFHSSHKQMYHHRVRTTSKLADLYYFVKIISKDTIPRQEYCQIMDDHLLVQGSIFGITLVVHLPLLSHTTFFQFLNGYTSLL